MAVAASWYRSLVVYAIVCRVPDVSSVGEQAVVLTDGRGLHELVILWARKSTLTCIDTHMWARTDTAKPSDYGEPAPTI